MHVSTKSFNKIGLRNLLGNIELLKAVKITFFLFNSFVVHVYRHEHGLEMVQVR